MSALSELLEHAKDELNRELNRQKPKIITAVKKEIAKAKAKGGATVTGAIKDAAIKSVNGLHIFGAGSILVTTLIASVDLSKYEHLGDAKFDQIETEITKRIQGARL